MGQKVNPIGFRIGVNKTWSSLWYGEKNYADNFHEDLSIRSFLTNRLKNAELGGVEIIRYPERVVINISTGRPGIVIGRKGNDIENLKKHIQTMTSKKVQLNIQELKNRSLNATLIAGQIARQLEGRFSHKRAMKQAIQNSMKAGAKGVKILLSGRLGGSDMARREYYKEGQIPLHTLRSDLDYALAESLTKVGMIGVKVWLYRGEILPKEKIEKAEKQENLERREKRERREKSSL